MLSAMAFKYAHAVVEIAIRGKKINLLTFSLSWGLYHKTYYGRNLRPPL